MKNLKNIISKSTVKKGIGEIAFIVATTVIANSIVEWIEKKQEEKKEDLKLIEKIESEIVEEDEA